MSRTWKALLLALSSMFRPGVAASQAVMEGGPAIFTDAFTPGHSVMDDSRRVTFQPRLLGQFKLPSGRLVACDPFWCGPDLASPFLKEVPAGEFPVQLAIADFGDDQRVAFARIQFSREPVVRWEMALIPGDDVAVLQPGDILGYGVDAGTGSFMDMQAWQVFNTRMENRAEGFDDHLVGELEKNDVPTWSWLMMDVGPGSVALFSSGFGDGQYATYWGYDARGGMAVVLTDFYVVDWNPAAGAESPLR
jgi:hypothetical protein